MNLLNRTQTSQVDWEEETSRLCIRVQFADEFHLMGVCVRFSVPELEIVEVQPYSERTPYPICPNAIARLQNCVGEKVNAGIALAIRRHAGGREGCRHYSRLLTDACDFAVQGLLTLQSRREGRQGAIPSHEKMQLLEERGWNARNSCLAYADSPVTLSTAPPVRDNRE